MFNPRTLFLISFFSLVLMATSTFGQVDSNTLLSLKFENSLSGEQGEAPTAAVGAIHQAGIQGQGVYLGSGARLSYLAQNNIDAREGTIEFWIKPSWNGNDNQYRDILDWDTNCFCGIAIEKSGFFNELIFHIDRWGNPWKDLPVTVSQWRANEWHYVAITYSNSAKLLQIYIDGSLRGQETFTGELPLISPTNFRIGSLETNRAANALLDEFRISNRVRTSQEISARFFSAINVNSLQLTASTRKLWPTWRVPVRVTAETSIGNLLVSTANVTWTSADPNVAYVNTQGEIVATQGGVTVLTATVNGTQATMNITVQSPVRPPRVEVPTGDRAVPTSNSLFEIPVVSLRYIPTVDGINLDTSWSPGYWELEPITLAQLEQNLDRYDEILKYMSEEGSRFRGYGSRTPVASVGYRIVATITVYEPPPPGHLFEKSLAGLPAYKSNMFQIFERLGLAGYVEQQGIKEFWYWTKGVDPRVPSYNPAIHPPENIRADPESNMASPTTGDISNSYRDNTDLPLLSKTYVVRFQDMRRLDVLTLHIDCHQWEQMLTQVNILRDGNNHLFWRNFVGNDTNDAWQKGRAGWTHNPPNANGDYDYNNYTPYDSDIRDWRPDGTGQKQPYSAAVPRDIPYALPFDFLPDQRAETHWYIFWRQSMPGFGNSIPYQRNGLSFKMTNWWLFQGDWDRAIRAGVGLYEPADCGYTLSSTSTNMPAAGGAGSVSVTSSTGCKWFASNNAMWTPLTSGDIGNGSGTVNFTVQPNISSSPRTTRIVVAGQPFTVNQATASTPLSIGGKVTTPTGQGLRNAIVVLIDAQGARRTATTSSFGLYKFADVASGQTYTVSVSSKRYRFAPRQLTATASLSNLDFVGLE